MKVLASRRAAMLPFTIVGGAAIVAGGMIAARQSFYPIPVMVWMVAYLVLVVGATQYALGFGQARLADQIPSESFVALQWLAFNLGNAGVIAGTLCNQLALTIAGSVLVIAAMLLFIWGGRGSRHFWWRLAYYLLAVLIGASAIVGAMMAINGHGQ